MVAIPEEERRLIGARVAKARRAGGMTQGQLATRLGVTTRSIQNYEAGVFVPHNHLRQIAAVGHVSVSWLLTGGGRRPIDENVESLRKLTEQHQALLERHAEALNEQMQILRRAREAREAR